MLVVVLILFSARIVLEQIEKLGSLAVSRCTFYKINILCDLVNFLKIELFSIHYFSIVKW
jgi:hypothetical protein